MVSEFITPLHLAQHRLLEVRSIIENIEALSSYGLRDHQLYLDEIVNSYDIAGNILTIPLAEFSQNISLQISSLNRTLEDLQFNIDRIDELADTIMADLEVGFGLNE